MSIHPEKPNIFRVQLDGNTAARLRRYSRFTGSGTIDSIVKAALNYSFDADNDFLEWEKNPENQSEPEGRKRKHPNRAATPNGAASAATVSANK